jgi:hypothetical protein
VPIGSITPGSRVAVTPSASPVMPSAASAPSPTMPVLAQDVIDLWLAVLDTAACAINGSTGGTYALGNWITLTAYGILFDPGVARFAGGGNLDVNAGGIVTSNATSEWGGTFPFIDAAITLDGTSTLTVLSGGEIDGASGSKFGGQWNYLGTSTVWHRGDLHIVGTEYVDSAATVTYNASATVNGTLNFSGNMNITNLLTLKSSGYGMTVEPGVAVDCYNGGGRVLPKTAPYVGGGGTVTPWATAAAIPEIIDLTLTADTTIVIPVGTAGSTCHVSVLNDGGGFTATMNFQGTSPINQTLRNATSGTTPENRTTVTVRSTGTTWKYIGREVWFA